MKGLRALPSVDRLLSAPAGQALVDRHGRQAATDALRTALEGARAAVRESGGDAPEPEAIWAAAAARLDDAIDSLTLATQVVVLDDGRVAQTGTPHDVARRPP